MKIQIPLIILALIFFELAATGQTVWFTADSISQVKRGNATLQNPWSGGLNAVQYSKMDLDNDGVEDLVAFDRTTSKVSTFIADPETKSFHYRQEFEALFPAMANWMLLVDYNNDGKKELFTYVSYGLTVYQQAEDTETGWKWVNMKEYLTVKGLSGNTVNLYIAASDIPALVDVDGDGDMDIVAFESGGDYLEFNQNMSMERYGVADSLEFERNGQCWGNFRKHTCGDFEFGVDCGVSSGGGNDRVKHAGNSILLYDFNGDGKKDMLLGNVDCENLNLVFNDRDGIAANFSSFLPSYPQQDPAVMSVFPSGYLEDVDFDGVKDLLVSPNVYGNDNQMMDFVSSGWYYHNRGTDQVPDFQLRQKDFLQSEMVDVGENAAASFFDIDGDGDMDLIIGNRGRYDGTNFSGSLWLYKNNGTAAKPVYELESSDYLELAQLMGHNDLQPQWLDFNGDGKIDLGLASVSDRRLWYHYFPNQASVSSPSQLNYASKVAIALPLELSVSDRVFFVDQDRDGDPDLVVGGVLGNVSYYENTGSAASPNFVLRDAALGGLGPAFSRRYLSVAVADINVDGNYDLLTLDQGGRIHILYEGAWGSWTKKDTSVVLNREMGGSYSPFLGTRLHAAVADFNGDLKPDLAVGTAGGGMYLYRNILPFDVTGNEPEVEFFVYPNPATDVFSVKSGERMSVDVFNMLGQKVFSGEVQPDFSLEIDARAWGSGVYVVRGSSSSQTQVRKLVVSPSSP